MLYYASKISDNISKTPEGFLLCRNVPIARIGSQNYMVKELPALMTVLVDFDQEDVVTVYREAEDVFAPSAMASFEGKPVINEHPENVDTVEPSNAAEYVKGTAQNIRRGGDFVIADLLIYDAILISEIENGKRDVSCGYKCIYKVRDKRICQTSIIGNHIAVVGSGRAGEEVSIRDESPDNIQQKNTQPERSKKRKMSKAKKNKKTRVASALANMFPHFSKDSKPDELAELVEDLVEAVEEEVKEDIAEDIAEKIEEEVKEDDKSTTVKDSDYEKLYGIVEKVVEKLDGVCEEIKAIKENKTDSDDLLEKLEEELLEDAEDSTDSEDGYEEEKVVESTEAINAKDAALKALKQMKPIIANIKDAKQRKIMSDNTEKMIRATYGIQPSGRTNGGYSGIINAQKTAAQTNLDSAAKKKPIDYAAVQKKIEDERLGKK